MSFESSVGAGGWGGGEMGGWIGGGREECREGGGWNGERVSEFLLCSTQKASQKIDHFPHIREMVW